MQPSGGMARRFLVRGQVQGVGFRDWTVGRANAIGIAGWVRNRQDGGVDVVLDGTDDRCADMIPLLQAGPARATVDCVTEEAASPSDAADIVARTFYRR